MADQTFPKIASLKSVQAFRLRLSALNLNLPCDDSVLSAAQNSPLSQPINVGGFIVGNRWCIHPMEGWDGTTSGEPTEPTLRRWEHFGASGAKLIWGGEAFAVQNDARANPNQLGIIDDNIERAEKGARALLQTLLDAHRREMGTTNDLLVGLQLTHSGRFCRPDPDKRLVPRIAYHHPLLDKKFGIAANDDSVLISDDYLKRLIDNFVRAARLAQRAGYQFVDVKHCHGYLGHELLSGFTRKGAFGGSFENRTRFARETIERIRSECPGLMIGVRLSAFDHPPFHPDPKTGAARTGAPEAFASHLPYHFGFGCDASDPLKQDLAEPIRFIRELANWGAAMVNVSCCSPYYNPHFQRPAIFPPSDGYQPPEDPLVGVVRQIHAVRDLKKACPNIAFVGSGYTYLQEYLTHVAQPIVRENWTDFVGLGRMVLSYWQLPADTLAGRGMAAKRICRTFSDCTTAPRNGLISGCFPLDDYYKSAPQHEQLKRAKEAQRQALKVLES